MRERRDTARPIDNTDHVGWRRSAPWNESRFAFANQLIERLAHVGDMSRFDKGPCHQWTADRIARAAWRNKRRAIDRLADGSQPVRYLGHAPHSIGALPREKLGERGIFALDEVSQHVHVTAV